jgi:hypothetical protein
MRELKPDSQGRYKCYAAKIICPKNGEFIIACADHDQVLRVAVDLVGLKLKRSPTKVCVIIKDDEQPQPTSDGVDVPDCARGKETAPQQRPGTSKPTQRKR